VDESVTFYEQLVFNHRACFGEHPAPALAQEQSVRRRLVWMFAHAENQLHGQRAFGVATRTGSGRRAGGGRRPRPASRSTTLTLREPRSAATSIASRAIVVSRRGKPPDMRHMRAAASAENGDCAPENPARRSR